MYQSASKKTILVLAMSFVLFLFALPSISTATFAQSTGSRAVIRNPLIAGYSTCDLNLATAAIDCLHGSASAADASFKVPKVTCNPSEGVQGEAILVNLVDNLTEGPFAAAGVLTSCVGSTAYYSAVVLGPNTGLSFSYLYVVRPGDAIDAGLTLVHGTLFYSVADSTSRSISKGQLSAGSDDNLGAVAAVVALTAGPSTYLEQFTRVQITSFVTINGKTTPIGAISPAKAILTDTLGKIVEAVPSALSKDGTSFSITWKGN
jgi:hypothetical protein